MDAVITKECHALSMEQPWPLPLECVTFLLPMAQEFFHAILAGGVAVVVCHACNSSGKLWENSERGF